MPELLAGPASPDQGSCSSATLTHLIHLHSLLGGVPMVISVLLVRNQKLREV